MKQENYEKAIQISDKILELENKIQDIDRHINYTIYFCNLSKEKYIKELETLNNALIKLKK